MKQTIRLTESELKHIIMESVKRVINEDYDGENELWNAAKKYLDCEVMLNYIEHCLDNDGLLDEYARRLDNAFDISSTMRYYQTQDN